MIDVSHKASYSLPRMDTSLENLSHSKWYSILHLASGYCQKEMYENDKEKETFILPMYGLHQFKVMPFGLSNAAPTFERLMEKILIGLHSLILIVYLDDIFLLRFKKLCQLVFILSTFHKWIHWPAPFLKLLHHQ